MRAVTPKLRRTRIPEPRPRSIRYCTHCVYERQWVGYITITQVCFQLSIRSIALLLQNTTGYSSPSSSAVVQPLPSIFHMYLLLMMRCMHPMGSCMSEPKEAGKPTRLIQLTECSQRTTLNKSWYSVLHQDLHASDFVPMPPFLMSAFIIRRAGGGGRVRTAEYEAGTTTAP